MKCIHCQTDSTYRERSERRCPKCGHSFAFEPKNGDKLTDAGFQAAIAGVSSGGSVRWTLNHLHYEVARRMVKPSRTWVLFFTFFGAAGFMLALLRGRGPLLAILLACFVALSLLYFFWPRSPLLALSESEFSDMWGCYKHAHGEPKGLIRPPALEPAAKTRPLPPDVQAYSFDRAVITDRQETADLLLANNFHFENNCAVLTEGGYPAAVFDLVRGMLRKNPRLVVFVLHDASLEGCTMVSRLRASTAWFQASARLVDVGLHASQTKPFRGLWRPSRSFLGDTSSLSSSARRFLDGHTVELAAVRPEQVIKRLFRAMTSAQGVADDSVASGPFVIDSDAFSSDASASDGGGDSFG